MSMEVLVSIVGAFGVIALGINAFFLKGIYSELNDVRIQMATMLSNNTFLQTKVQELETRVNQHEAMITSQMLEIERLKK